VRLARVQDSDGGAVGRIVERAGPFGVDPDSLSSTEETDVANARRRDCVGRKLSEKNFEGFVAARELLCRAQSRGALARDDEAEPAKRLGDGSFTTGEVVTGDCGTGMFVLVRDTRDGL